MITTKTVYLDPIDLSENNIKEKIICIRSHRERIFRVEKETIEDKTIFHNYGHGGAGWTFLFGSVYESINQIEHFYTSSPDIKPIAVIGTGCYGLLTAILLKRKGYDVSLVSDPNNASSSGKAAGFFFPRPRKNSSQEEKQTFLDYGIASFTTYLNISRNEHAFIKKGARLLPSYFGPDIDPGFDEYIQRKLIPPKEEVIIDFKNGKKHKAVCYQSIFIDVPIMMAELKKERARLNIKLIEKKIISYHQLSEIIIVNCSGRGAKDLTGDKRLIPVQGHLIALESENRPNYMINFKVTMIDSFGKVKDKMLYYAPKEGGILGITFLRNQNDTHGNTHEFNDLLKRARDFFGN